MSDKTTNSIHVRFNKDLLDKVDNFTDKFHFSSRTEAIRYLISLGLSFHEEAENLVKLNTNNKNEK